MQDFGPFQLDRRSFFRFASALASIAAVAASSPAAEIRLKSHVEVSGSLLTLGDVAEIFAADAAQAQRLAAMELIPAPAPGSQEFLRAREVRDMLTARGADLVAHRLSGSSRISVTRAATVQPVSRETSSSVVSPAAEARVRRAIQQYLSRAAEQTTGIEIRFALTPQQSQAIVQASSQIHVIGGRPPYDGPQQFELSMIADGQPVRFSVAAEIVWPEAIVVATRTISRGTLVQRDDLQLVSESQELSRGARDVFHSIVEAVGQEATRNIPAGQAVDRRHVRAPILVHRGEVVTVYSRAGSVRVRLYGRALDEGSRDELITVETLDDRRRFEARVVDYQTVTVWARSKRIAPSRELSPAAR